MFESAKLKIDRANHHISDVERQWGVFLKKKIHGIVKDSTTDGTLHSFSVEHMKGFPSEIALTIGDAIHNLRTALDHLTWEVVGRDHGTQDRHLKFPAYHDRTSFEAACNGIVTPSMSVKEMFKALEAFPRGKGHFLYVLHHLDNIDKHSILTPILQVSKITRMIVRNSAGDILKIIENPSPGGFIEGESLAIDTFPDNSFVDFNNDVDIAPDILFGQVKFVDFDPIIPTLFQLSDAAHNTVKIVEGSVV
jgi:hypothetical protein